MRTREKRGKYWRKESGKTEQRYTLTRKGRRALASWKARAKK